MSSVIEVVVRGRPGGELRDALVDFDVRTDPDGLTRIVGEFADQSRLLGLLHAMDDLHVELVSVNTITRTASDR